MIEQMYEAICVAGLIAIPPFLVVAYLILTDRHQREKEDILHEWRVANLGQDRDDQAVR